MKQYVAVFLTLFAGIISVHTITKSVNNNYGTS
jgi:hypothetical protein